MEIGSRVGPYEIRERIGEGGMATVYKVWHTGLHRFEAFKVPRQHGSHNADSDFVQRLLNEARIAAQLHHPHIVGIHNVSEADAPVQFFAMEYVAGYDLAQLLERRERLSIQETLPILRQVAEALDHAHMHGVVHRDIKPGNILLQEVSNPGGWMAKVGDFGISRAAEDTGGTKLTKSGMIVGTPEYMSPEQAGNGDPVDYRTDVYSLGVVAYEMLCGHPPFTAGEGVSRMSILMSHVRDMPRPLAEHIPNLPIAANNAVLKALAKHPAERFESCAEFMRALSGAVTVAPPAMFGMATAPAGTLGGARTPTPLPMIGTETLASTQTAGAKSSRDTLALVLVLIGAAVGTWLWSSYRGGPQYDEGLPPAPATTPVIDATPTPRPTLPPTPQPTAKPTPQPTPRPTAKPAAPALRIQKVLRTRVIPFGRRVTRSGALPAGQRRVTRRGKNGAREVTLQITSRGGRELARKVLATRVVRAPVTQQEIVGTRVVRAPVRRAPVRRAPAPRRAAPRPRVQRPTSRPAPRRVAPRQRPRRPSTTIREAPLPR